MQEQPTEPGGVGGPLPDDVADVERGRHRQGLPIGRRRWLDQEPGGKIRDWKAFAAVCASVWASSRAGQEAAKRAAEKAREDARRIEQAKARKAATEAGQGLTPEERAANRRALLEAIPGAILKGLPENSTLFAAVAA